MTKKIYFLKSNFFNHREVMYGFFSRKGGVSSKPFNTLNCSRSTKDLKKNINKNIKLALNTLNFLDKDLVIGNQYHSKKVVIIDEKFNFNKIYKADGFVTQSKNTIIGILTADCAPIFFYDPIRKIIAAAHAGWKGCLKNICSSVIKSMNKLGSINEDIESIIGPCIDIKNYEVSKDLYLKFCTKNMQYKKFFIKKSNNKYLFNLAKALKYQLVELNIKKVILNNEDTYNNYQKYYSHRRSSIHGEKETGRMINIIGFLRK